MTQQVLLIIDGHALAYRYYFALERSGMKTADDRPVWAVFGFFKCIFDLLKATKVNPDLMAVTFDVGRHTYRVDMYPEYKANRESMPDAMHLQLGEIVEGLQAFNIPIFTKEGFEADDLIGTIAEIAKNDGIKTMILTGDRDSFQLVDDEKGVSVIMPSKGEIVNYDSKKVYERMGIYPEQVVDFKALAGDTSDNIPGIKGIGDKTAVKLLNEYKTLDNIYENLENISGKALKQKLADGKQDAYLSRELATIQRNVEMDFDIKDTCLELPDKQKVMDFFRKNSFYAFIKSSDEILSHFSESPICSEESNSQPVIVGENGQLGLFATEFEKSQKSYNHIKAIADTKEKLSELVSKLNKQTLISVDTETTGLNPYEDDLVGISLAFSECLYTKNNRVKINSLKDDTVYSYYIPLFHTCGEQPEFEDVVSILAPVFADKKISFTMQNAKFDLQVLKNHNMPVKNLIFDTMLASYVNDSTRKHGLKTQSELYLGYIMSNYENVTGNANFSEVEIKKAADYSCDDAFATIMLTKYWSEKLSEKELDILYDMEVPLTVVLMQMEENGISVDTEYLKKLSEYTAVKLRTLEKKIFKKAEEKFNINSPKQVADVLFNKLALTVNGKKVRKKGTGAKVLETLAEEHEIAKDILDYRHITKLKSSYIDSLPELISSKDKKIHTSFNQTITVTGRLSSSNPNLQNIPARTELGNKIRGAFVPKDRENYRILSADYSQIELRLMAHCSQDENLLRAFRDDIDVHAVTASKVYGIPIEAVTDEMRFRAKAVNFGIIYGQSKYGLASSLGISSLEAEEFILKYFATYPKVKEYMYEQIEFANKHGYVETIFGRKRRLDMGLISSSAKEREAAQRAAINSPLQGSAADLIKIAMVRLQKSLSELKLKSKIVLQVHDELVLEMLNSEKEIVIKTVREAMEEGFPLTVPLKVDIECGKNLMELK